MSFSGSHLKCRGSKTILREELKWWITNRSFPNQDDTSQHFTLSEYCKDDSEYEVKKEVMFYIYSESPYYHTF